MSWTLSSTAFAPGSVIPKKYTGDGPDVSPPLIWNEPPPGAKSFVLIADDPDAPAGNWVHWILFNVPGDVRALPEAILPQAEFPNGARHGTTDFHRLGYGGPLPPKGLEHRYFFRLYALDSMIVLPAGVRKPELLQTMTNHHVLGLTELVGTYKR